MRRPSGVNCGSSCSTRRGAQSHSSEGWRSSASHWPRSALSSPWPCPALHLPRQPAPQLSPELYRQESQRIAARFDETIRLAEEAFTAKLAKLVAHLTERLSGRENGKPRIFRDSAIEKLSDFFQRFRALNVGSSEQLDRLVNHVQNFFRGVEPQQLRDMQSLRQQIATHLSGVQATLDGLMFDRRRRNIVRQPKSSGGLPCN